MSTIEDVLGPLASAALHREQPAAALAALDAAAAGESPSPASTLARVFVLGAPARRADLAARGPDRRCRGLERLGLVATSGTGGDDEVRGLVDLRPYATADDAGDVCWWLASDRGAMVTGAPLHPDHVLGVGGASLTLASLTVRDHRARTLDLGTGCGIQALHAARHSDRVTATDISGRALAFAAFNASLAGVGVDLRSGSLLEPVHGEQFDLVVSNPPFVITPRSASAGDEAPAYTYRDGGMAGDALVAQLVTGMAGVLEPGGLAQLMGNWEHRAGEGWTDRVGGWLDASGLDGWVVQREVLDPAEYAEMWLRDGGSTRERDPDAWDRRMSRVAGRLRRKGRHGRGPGFRGACAGRCTVPRRACAGSRSSTARRPVRWRPIWRMCSPRMTC